MRTHPIPFNDPARLSALRSLPGLTPESEPLFEKLTDAVRVLFECPVAHISLVEDDHQWFKAVVGVDLPTIPRDHSFCAHTIMSDDFMVVSDLAATARFAGHPMVANEPHVRFYAGAPLILSNGFRIGSICALDFEPHEQPSDAALAALRALADTITAAFERQTPAPVSVEETKNDGKREFLALIGHEFRTPLTKILGYSGLLAETVEGPGAHLAEATHSAAKHLLRLTETVITFADAATGDLHLNEEPASLEDLAREACKVQGPALDGSKKSITVEKFDLPGPILIDAPQIRLALAALIDNASLHGGDALELRAGLNSDGNVEIEIKDNGTFDASLATAMLYEPFVVGEDIDTRKVGGLGMGLPLARKLVELHGGEFELLHDDAGTVARIVLPGWRLKPGVDAIKRRVA